MMLGVKDELKFVYLALCIYRQVSRLSGSSTSLRHRDRKVLAFNERLKQTRHWQTPCHFQCYKLCFIIKSDPNKDCHQSAQSRNRSNSVL